MENTITIRLPEGISPSNVRFIRGGIGDILLRVDNIIPDEYYIVISHYPEAASLIKPYTDKFQVVPMEQAFGGIEREVEPITYPNIKIPEKYLTEAKESLDTSKMIIGLHPIGSKLSINFDYHYNRPVKFMPPPFIQELVRQTKTDDIEFLLFCSPEEVFIFKDLGLRIVSEPDVWKSFSYVSYCDVMVGVDSALKTVSAILHKPTLVLLGDYEDEGRDIFIKPYKEITTVKFYNIEYALCDTVQTLQTIISSVKKDLTNV